MGYELDRLKAFWNQQVAIFRCIREVILLLDSLPQLAPIGSAQRCCSCSSK